MWSADPVYQIRYIILAEEKQIKYSTASHCVRSCSYGEELRLREPLIHSMGTPKPTTLKISRSHSSLLKPHLLQSNFKVHTHFHCLHYKRTLSLTIACELKTSKGNVKNKNKLSSSKIVLPEGAPSLSENDKVAQNGQTTAKPRGTTDGPVLVFVKKLPRKILSVLSNLPLAIGEMFAIAGLMALGLSLCLSLAFSVCLSLCVCLCVSQYNNIELYSTCLWWLEIGRMFS